MSRILFHLNSISERGTTTAAIEYARELRNYGNEIQFSYDINETSSHPLFVEKVAQEFPVVSYFDFREFAELQGKKFDYAYFLKSGENDGKLIPEITNYIHVVFQNFDPHGDKYSYVSEWLAKDMASRNLGLEGDVFTWIPHIVDMPSQDRNLRESLGIPSSAICGIRIGGRDSFDIQFVRDVVSDLSKRSEFYFIFVNTEQFIEAPNVRFLNTVFDKQIKANLLASADYFLHARTRGETFGISIVEAMQMGIPVFAWQGVIDRNHSELLPAEYLYKNSLDLTEKIVECRKFSSDTLCHSAEIFRPANVMGKFLEVFPID
jgi:hypothetical protein